MIRIKAGLPRRVRGLGPPAAWGVTALTHKLGCPPARQIGLGARMVSTAVLLALGTGIVLRARRALLRESRQARRIACVAQRALLPPLPPKVGGLGVAVARLSADPGATTGGDLYEAVGTAHGVRVVMGDARGHGLAAAGTAAAVLGGFREAVHDGKDLEEVLRRLDLALARRLRERARDGTTGEDFATVLLLEIGADGEMRALNCGHPWPYLITGTEVEPLARTDPLPPLGLFPLPEDLPVERCGRLLPGQALLLHTDGAEDARDARGRFFPLRERLAAAREESRSPRAVLRQILTALLHHTDGHPADDVALLMLHHEGARTGPDTVALAQGADSLP